MGAKATVVFVQTYAAQAKMCKMLTKRKRLHENNMHRQIDESAFDSKQRQLLLWAGGCLQVLLDLPRLGVLKGDRALYAVPIQLEL